MNKRRLEAIAKWLGAGAPHKKGVVGFDMSYIQNNTACGAVCCIAGAANQFFGQKHANSNTGPDWQLCSDGTNPVKAAADQAAKLLALDKGTADKLFFPDSENHFESPEDAVCELNQITPAHAAKTIRHLISTGEVDWHLETKGKRQ